MYFKTDTHWNDLGAFYAYQAIINSLAQSMPISDFTLASLEQYEIDVKPFEGGDIAVNMLSSPGRFKDVQVLLNRKTVNAELRAKLGGQMLIVGDSFSNGLSHYFAQNYSVFRNVRFDDLPVPSFLAGGPQPLVVVFETAERYLTNMAKWDFDWKQFCPH